MTLPLFHPRRARALGAWTLAAAALLALAPGAMAGEMRRLKAAEIEYMLIGNTLTGASNAGCPFLDFYSIDGTAASQCGDHRDTGFWRIEADDHFCVDWSKLADPYCLEVYTDGRRVAVRNPRLGDELHPVILIQGDRRR
jgi:hypothetical protein